MSALLEYVKSFLALFLLIKILLYLAPKKIFSGYISFFSGVILALGMLYPILKLFGSEEMLLEKIQYEEWEEKMYELSIDAKLWQAESLDQYEDLLEEVMQTESFEGDKSLRNGGLDD